MFEASSLSSELKSEAARLGFALAGICPAATPPGIARLDEWLSHGFAGQMHYLADRRAAYDHPRSVLDGAKSIVMLAMNYRSADPAIPAPGEGRVSRYAWGEDYHGVIRARLNDLADFVRRRARGALVRGVVDTAPLLEREFAQLAGLGWIGKNTLLLNRQMGSWFFLAALLTDVELEYDAAHETDHCGTCRACLDACPTEAFAAPYVLDARRCISYLTIELREQVPEPLREGMGEWLFGCDVCQDVCPWNRKAPSSDEESLAPLEKRNPIPLAELFFVSDAEFRRRFRGSPLLRAKRRGLLRNAAIVLGNQRDPAALTALTRGLSDDEPLVRGAAAWALGQLATLAARAALDARMALESDAEVSREIIAALNSQSAAKGGRPTSRYGGELF